jgi:hypothetical protein
MFSVSQRYHTNAPHMTVCEELCGIWPAELHNDMDQVGSCAGAQNVVTTSQKQPTHTIHAIRIK